LPSLLSEAQGIEGEGVSVEAITWALAQPVRHSSAKFVLVVMANRADGDMICWPSMADVSAQTAQDRKTVQENIRRLREAGFIEDTGERKGSTKQVIVYRLKAPEIGPVEVFVDTKEPDVKGTENGSVKEAQKRNSTEFGTGPDFPSKRPEIPGKEAQISHERGPKTGHGTIKEPSRNRQGTISRDPGFDMLAELLNLGVALKHARDWMTVRKKKNAPETETALDGLIREAAKAGLTVAEAVQMCAERSWQSLNAKWLAPTANDARASPNSTSSPLGKAGQATAAAAQRLIERMQGEQTN
jgi:DNA-binding transcriptional regulator YhcF (GntR family)